ncbi:hypothetical protein BJV82DRAFT_639481 [Fennellomyces sp. T-0311]|nr:hypothetical protein BJV82DRAFT_639481 [Fennellomyces sp. T-0311]
MTKISTAFACGYSSQSLKILLFSFLLITCKKMVNTPNPTRKQYRPPANYLIHSKYTLATTLCMDTFVLFTLVQLSFIDLEDKDESMSQQQGRRVLASNAGQNGSM